MDKSLKYSKVVIGFLTVIVLHAVQVALPELGIAAPAWLSGDGLSVLSVVQWIGAAIGVIGTRQAIGAAIVATKENSGS